MSDLRRLSFGGPAAIVTSMALIVGLGAATAGKAAIVGSLLVIGLADNLTNSLSVHLPGVPERLAHRQALSTTVANYIARLTVTVSFVLLVLLLPIRTAAFAAVAWASSCCHELSARQGAAGQRYPRNPQAYRCRPWRDRDEQS